MTLLECFPRGHTPREGQKRIIGQMEEAIGSGYQTIILCAPTGIGKSHIAATFAGYHSSSYVITAQKILQDQYSSDFGFLRVMKGKSNFPCLSLYDGAGRRYDGGPPARGMSCSGGICEWREGKRRRTCRYKPKMSDFFTYERGGHGFVLAPRNSCLYYAQKYTAMLSPHSLHNYATYLYHMLGTASAPRRECIVADEAHEIESQIASRLSCHITNERLQLTGSFLDDFLTDARSDICDAIGTLYLRCMDVMRQADRRDSSIPRGTEFANSLRVIHYEAANNPENVILQRNGTGVVVRPVSVAHVARRVFDADRRLFMSATIHPEMFIHEMGLDGRDCRFIEVESSPFPPANRRTQFVSAARLGKRASAEEYAKVYRAAASILRRHRDEKGLILATSKSQCRDIMRYLDAQDRKRIIVVHGDAGSRPSDLIRRHREERSPTVLLSPSLWHGIDLKGDLSRFQIILKAPYLSLNDDRIRARAQRDWQWYLYASTVKLLQGIGRSVRSPDDHAVTYLLDSAARTLLDETRRYVPVPYRDVLY